MWVTVRAESDLIWLPFLDGGRKSLHIIVIIIIIIIIELGMKRCVGELE